MRSGGIPQRPRHAQREARLEVLMWLIGLAVVLSFGLTLSAFTAEGQQAGKVYRIGFLSIATVTYIDAFRQGLRDLGYVEGRTIVIEYQEAQSYERLPELAKELVGLKPDIIVSAGGSLVARAVKAVTSTIPVVFSRQRCRRRWSRSKTFQARRQPYGPGNLYNPTRRQALRDSQGGSPDNHYRGCPLESWLCGIQCVESGGSATGYGSSRPGGRRAAGNA